VSEPFLGEIKLVSFAYAPQGWALCNGQVMPIAQNQALFSLLGTTYGGDGRTTFALPNLQARTPMHRGAGHTQGELGGEVDHTLSIVEMPVHVHAANATSNSATPNTGPSSSVVLAQSIGASLYGTVSNLVPMHGAALVPAGGTQPHPNMQPYLSLTFIIALQGIFPSQN
jgi:microcystin-dependent protein